MDEQEVGVEQARKTLGKLVDNAAVRGITSFITRHGRRHAAIMPIDQWERTREATLFSVRAAQLEIHRVQQTDDLRRRLSSFGLSADQIKEALETVEWVTVTGIEYGRASTLAKARAEDSGVEWFDGPWREPASAAISASVEENRNSVHGGPRED